jgi:HEPN superfamily RiboL-PSP-like protein
MSKRLTALKKEIESLRKLFLPDPFDPLGSYPNTRRVQAHTRAFLVLSHAEFETYFEEWAKEVARASETIWTKSQRVTTPLAFLLSWSEERLVPPETLSSPGAHDSTQELREIVAKLFPTFYKRIKDNHGVKERNVLSLFGPLGVPLTAFAPTLLPNLDALGTQRGVHAHQSAKAVVSVLDPETEYKRVEKLLLDAAVFDQWIVAYKIKIR